MTSVSHVHVPDMGGSHRGTVAVAYAGRVVERRDVGSWLGGTPEGEAAGLPREGRGTAAGLARRFLALCVDWLACLLVSAAFFPSSGTTSGVPIVGGDATATLVIFAAENLILVGTIGCTLGHRLLGLRVRRLALGADGQVLPDDSHAPGLGRAAVRTLLLCLVVPAAIQDGLGRGLHDRAAGTAIVRR